MRFCLVSTQQQSGGGEFLLASIAHELELAGHGVTWIIRKNSQLDQDLSSRGRHILHRLHGRGRSLKDLLGVRKVLRQWSPDVVIMNDTHAVMLAGLACADMGSARPIRLAYKHTVFPLRSRLKYQWLSDKVICVSQAARQKIVAGGLPLGDSAVVYGGISPPRSYPLEETRREVRQELGLDEQTLLILSIGSLLPVKGHADLLKALGLLSEVPDFRLLIAGEGEQRNALEKQIKDAALGNRVQLLGFRSDVDRLLVACDLLVHPSRFEGLSLVLIQAQMARKPIVATAVGGAAEVLDIAGEGNPARWIVKENNPASLASQLDQAIIALRSAESRSLLEASLDRVAHRAEERFSLKTNSNQLVEIAASLKNQLHCKAA